MDATQGRGALAWLYQQGLTIDEASKAGEFMYVNFRKKEKRGNDVESLCKFQESYLRECVLFTRNDLSEKNLSKLRFVLRKVLPIHVRYKNIDSKFE